MILRRLATSIRKQDWFAVVIETLIVVMGVFLGLQVNNWNEARQEAGLETDFLAGIVLDLQGDEQDLIFAINSAEASIGAARYALAAAGLNPPDLMSLSSNDDAEPLIEFVVPADRILSDDERLRLWSLTVVRYYATQSSTAFDTLMSTGRLDLIQDNNLVAGLQVYSAQWNGVVTSQNTTFRPFRNQTIFVGQKYGLSPFIEMPEDEFIALVRETPELAAVLRTMMEYTVVHRQQLISTLNTTTALLQAFDEEAAE